MATFAPDTHFGGDLVLWAMAILLLALWGVGLVTGAQLGLWLHLILVSSILVLALACVRGLARGPPRAGQAARPWLGR
jgi:hypothetical protein